MRSGGERERKKKSRERERERKNVCVMREVFAPFFIFFSPLKIILFPISTQTL
jgi:hypothetical protein